MREAENYSFAVPEAQVVSNACQRSSAHLHQLPVDLWDVASFPVIQHPYLIGLTWEETKKPVVSRRVRAQSKVVFNAPDGQDFRNKPLKELLTGDFEEAQANLSS